MINSTEIGNFTIAIIGALICTSSAALSCPPFSDWEKIALDARLQYVIIGEEHGTFEVPKLFGELVCIASLRRNVIVALEVSADNEKYIKHFMKSDGRAEAQSKLLSAPIWHSRLKDGRSSQGYFQLLLRLRDLVASGRVVTVKCVMPHEQKPFDAASHERRMAQKIRSAGNKQGLVVALVGNVHAMRGQVPFKPFYYAMTSFLPKLATVSLNVVSNGGQSWSCSGQPSICGVYESPLKIRSEARKVEYFSSADYRYSANLYLGTSTTAAPPQK